jgi:hypothetical protein
MRARCFAAIAVVVCLASASCSRTSANTGDCNADLRLRGDTYRIVSGMHTPHRGEPVGTGTWLDCEGDPVREMGEARTFGIRGHDSPGLVIVAEEGGDVVYMKDTIAWRDRPEWLKESERYLTCNGPARFLGTWDYVDPEDMPNLENYESAQVPYTASFSVWEGTGVGMDSWAIVSLQAEITRDTQPQPSAKFLEKATSQNAPVHVTATCRGGSFLVDSIRFVR